MLQKIRLIFAGTSDFAVPSLQILAQQPDFEILQVLTPQDQPAGRQRQLRAPPVKIFAKQAELPLRQITGFDSAVCQELQQFQPDFLVVVALRFRVPREILALPKFGCVNLHASLLPKFRGAAPITAAILAGEQVTGVSFQQMAEGLDTGPLWAKFQIPLAQTETKEALMQKLAQLGATQFPAVLRQIKNRTVKAQVQNEAQASFCTKLTKNTGYADFQQTSAPELLAKLRALGDWPGVWTVFQKQVLKLQDFQEAEIKKLPADLQPGQVFAADQRIYVALQQGALELKTVQLAGKKPLAIQDFVRGQPALLGSQLGYPACKQLLLATSNPSKIKEITTGLQSLNLALKTPQDFALQKFPVESGTTFQANARIKAEFFQRLTHLPVLADDSGILVQAFPGKFGVHTARAFGPNLTDAEWLQEFLTKMQGAQTRRAKFVCVLALAYPDLPTQFFRGAVQGEILSEAAAPLLPGIPLSSVFRPFGSEQVFAALTPTEKSRFSHRGLALKKLAEFLQHS